MSAAANKCEMQEPAVLYTPETSPAWYSGSHMIITELLEAQHPQSQSAKVSYDGVSGPHQEGSPRAQEGRVSRKIDA